MGRMQTEGGKPFWIEGVGLRREAPDEHVLETAWNPHGHPARAYWTGAWGLTRGIVGEEQSFPFCPQHRCGKVC